MSAFDAPCIHRDLLKAYTAFTVPSPDPVSTGNWGCGAFFGCRQLKSTIQWIAASHAHRQLYYHTFGDSEFTASLQGFIDKLTAANVTATDLYNSLMRIDARRNCVFEQILNDLQIL
eukprot:TRINITY_DN20585_c0_g1_i2.p1 TRINITY_DN20585_c0_g1~~TRINITY_DN20585_c0_g1_i2.p1  ORF type:complete len:117 (+),score=28.04 TRINITY_DN20585_c0_g1_i2:206-556(+)